MTNRIPLIVNAGAAQIQEISDTDVLQVPGTFTANVIQSDNYQYANGAPFSGGGSGNATQLVNGTYAFSLTSTGTLLPSYGNSLPANFVIDPATVEIDLRNNNRSGIFTQEDVVTITTNDTFNWNFDQFGNLSIPPGGNITAYAGGAVNIAPGAASTTFYGNGTVAFSGDVVPKADNAQSLGNAFQQWSDLWVSNATIYMNSVPLSLSADNVLTINGQAILSNDSNTNITTTGNITAFDISADDWVYANIGVETRSVQFTNDGTGNSVNLLISNGALVYESTAGIDGGFVPSNNNSEAIGQDSRRWNQIYGNVINATTLISTSNVNANVFVLNNAGALTTSVIQQNQNPPLGSEAFGIEMLTTTDDPAIYSSVSAGPDYVSLQSSNAGNANVTAQGGYGVTINTSDAIGGNPKDWSFTSSGTAYFPGDLNLNGSISTLGNVSVQGDVSAIGNVYTDGFFIGNFQGNIVANIVVPGSNTQVLFNTNGNADAVGGLTYDKGSNTLAILGTVTAQGNVYGEFFTSNIGSIGALGLPGSQNFVALGNTAAGASGAGIGISSSTSNPLIGSVLVLPTVIPNTSNVKVSTTDGTETYNWVFARDGRLHLAIDPVTQTADIVTDGQSINVAAGVYNYQAGGDGVFRLADNGGYGRIGVGDLTDYFKFADHGDFSAAGNIYGGYGHFLGIDPTGVDALYAGIQNFTPLGSNIIAQFSANVDAYAQINIQNISNGAQASSDLVLTADNGTDSSNYVDLGIAGSGYNYPGYGAYSANDGYLLVDGGNLLLNVESTGKVIKYVFDGYDNVVSTMSNVQFSTTGNIVSDQGISGNTVTTNTLILNGGNYVDSLNTIQANYGLVLHPTTNTGGTGPELYISYNDGLVIETLTNDYFQGGTTSAPMYIAGTTFNSPGKDVGAVELQSGTNLADNSHGVVRVRTTNATAWTFDPSGNLTLPSNTFAVNYANGTPVSLGGGVQSSIANGTSNISITTANGNIDFNVNGAPYGSLGVGVALGYGAGNGFGNIANAIQVSGVAIGTQAGQTNQGTHGIAVGWRTGENLQGNSTVAIGENAAFVAQGDSGIAIGTVAARQSQGADAIAIGRAAGYTSQGANAIAIGQNSGSDTQGINAVALGLWAGNVSQGGSAVALGAGSGQNTQGINAVAVGSGAGSQNQAAESVAVGAASGAYNQSSGAIAIGSGAAYSNQGVNAIAIGAGGAPILQGNNAIAIGAVTSTGVAQPDNSIIIDATYSQLAATGAGLFVAPVRNDTGNVTNAVYYNTSTKEVTYGPAGGGSSGEASFSIQTSDFNANTGSRYGIDTTAGSVTATLPASPTTGEAVFFADAGGAYSTNAFIVSPNGGTIMGVSGSMTVTTDGQSFGLFYNGTTWRTYN